ncbi:MAG: hypothetical protein EAY81_06265 [Bacteroidetes bacterium]|nr:MAG: hypothetical protein EAY81_06265 [Bacteroidota bacterium]
MSKQNHITELHIENFKSIKQMDIKPKRINIFVGKPNVGKSNILEALSLLGESIIDRRLIRFNHAYQLFYDNEEVNPIKVFTNKTSAFINKANDGGSLFDFVLSEDGLSDNAYNQYREGALQRYIQQIRYVQENKTGMQFAESSDEDYSSFRWLKLERSGAIFGTEAVVGSLTSNLRVYKFDSTLKEFKNQFTGFLSTPFGDNLLCILNTNKSLRSTVASFFEEYGLDFLIDQQNNMFEIQKRVDGISYKYEYGLTADTLRRVIFYVAAIKSNTDAVLLFEEPEAHCFPPYIAQMAHEMIEAKTNQFFIATHSPYLLNTIVENTDYEECAVYVTAYKDYQTVVRELTRDEIGEMLNYGTDVFTNYEAFIN